jgi:hypothetical protein
MEEVSSDPVAQAQRLLMERWVTRPTSPNILLFRVPTAYDGRARSRGPYPVEFDELWVDDVVVMIELIMDADKETIDAVQFWYVLEIDNGCARVQVNSIGGATASEWQIFPRIAGTVGSASIVRPTLSIQNSESDARSAMHPHGQSH